jgi:hypothetical protein
MPSLDPAGCVTPPPMPPPQLPLPLCGAVTEDEACGEKASIAPLPLPEQLT